MYPDYFEGFRVIGIVKETGIDDEGLVDFHDKFFRFPLYRDQSFAFYHALGDRKVGLGVLFNPLSLIYALCDAYQRITSKNISGNMKGEGLIQGGLIVFSSDGVAKLMYQEQTGLDLPVTDICGALEHIRSISK